MRSERRLARVRDRYGAIFTASMSVMCVEAVVGAIALYLWIETEPSPDLPYNALNFVFWLVMLPVGLAAGAVVGALLSVGVVAPVIALAGWVGRRVQGREAWYWVPLLTAAAAVPLVLAEAANMVNAGGPQGLLVMWLLATAGLTPPALVARRLLLRDRPWVSGAAMFGRVALYGTLAVVTAFALTGFALWAGVGYEPPPLSREMLTGTWTDGKGGTLTLAADGRATADAMKTYDFDETPHLCSGSGAWSIHRGTGPWDQGVSLTVDGCDDFGELEFYGTREAPELFSYIGDPDSWNLYILKHRD